MRQKPKSERRATERRVTTRNGRRATDTRQERELRATQKVEWLRRQKLDADRDILNKDLAEVRKAREKFPR
jgi:hypothetical protein